MRATRTRASFVRLFALLAVLAMVAAACTGGVTADTTADTTGDTTGETTEETTPPDTGEDTTPEDTTGDTGGAGGEFDTYTLVIFQAVTTDNVWNLLDTAGNTVWNSYFLDPTTASAYQIALPGLEVVPELAAGELPPVTQEGAVWVGEFTLRDYATWSDGEPITAHDVAFTWNTAEEFELTS